MGCITSKHGVVDAVTNTRVDSAHLVKMSSRHTSPHIVPRHNLAYKQEEKTDTPGIIRQMVKNIDLASEVKYSPGEKCQNASEKCIHSEAAVYVNHSKDQYKNVVLKGSGVCKHSDSSSEVKYAIDEQCENTNEKTFHSEEEEHGNHCVDFSKKVGQDNGVWVCIDRDSGENNFPFCYPDDHSSDEPYAESVCAMNILKMPQLAIGKPAPDFCGTAVVNGDFKEIKLSDYRGKYLILFFYPLDFTFVCPTEIIAFSDRVEDFRSINCEVVAASTDSHFSHLAWVNTPRMKGGLGSMKIPLLADKTCEIARSYGCLKEDEGIAFRGLYIINESGILRQVTVNDLPVGRSVDETLRLVQAFQFTDKHGEVCPAGWRPGQDTIKPDKDKSKAYFQKNANASD